MSDARWTEIYDDIDAALRHFENAILIHDEGEISLAGLKGYKASMAFMHAMQSGHTSFEGALLRILKLYDEEKPLGESWHRDLIRRVSREVNNRPAVLDDDLAKAADETRAFRNVATRSYDNFRVDSAGPTVAAARVFIGKLRPSIDRFKILIDPPDDDGEGDGSGGSMGGGPT